MIRLSHNRKSHQEAPCPLSLVSIWKYSSYRYFLLFDRVNKPSTPLTSCLMSSSSNETRANKSCIMMHGTHPKQEQTTLSTASYFTTYCKSKQDIMLRNGLYWSHKTKRRNQQQHQHQTISISYIQNKSWRFNSFSLPVLPYYRLLPVSLLVLGWVIFDVTRILTLLFDKANNLILALILVWPPRHRLWWVPTEGQEQQHV